MGNKTKFTFSSGAEKELQTRISNSDARNAMLTPGQYSGFKDPGKTLFVRNAHLDAIELAD